MDERRRSNNTGRYASDYQAVSDARGTDKEEEWTKSVTGERERERLDVHASWAAKMTDMKSVSSMEVPEGKLVKKVSRCIRKKLDSEMC